MGVGSPPACETRYRVPAVVPTRITPSRLHVPPRAGTTSHNVCTGPPVASTFLSLPPLKKPMNRLSGDQKGGEGDPLTCVPASGLAVNESRERTHSKFSPSCVPTKADRKSVE